MAHMTIEDRIREKILSGALPRQHCRMAWYGPGRGSKCVPCDEPIRPDQVEVECDLPDGGTIVFRQDCHEAWEATWPGCGE
jgi:hypothetical protein